MQPQDNTDEQRLAAEHPDEYRTWRAMVSRCNEAACWAWPYYGDRDPDPAEQEVHGHIQAIVDLLGYTGESGTEAFVEHLAGVLPVIQERIARSHDEGLCWDAAYDLAVT